MAYFSLSLCSLTVSKFKVIWPGSTPFYCLGPMLDFVVAVVGDLLLLSGEIGSDGSR